MTNRIATLALLASVALAPAAHAGCATGAAVGGVAGHVAGHHALLGAAAGCAIGHHEAAKKAKAPRQPRPPHRRQTRPPQLRPPRRTASYRKSAADNPVNPNSTIWVLSVNVMIVLSP